MFDRDRRQWVAGLCIAIAAALATPTIAQSPIKLVSVVEVEKPVTGSDGNPSVRYEVPKVVVPGDRLRFTLRITNNGTAPAANVVINNPLPAEVSFESTADLANFAVSVDGGKNFGDLLSLTVADATGGTRPATAEDVTHVRWVVAEPVQPKSDRKITFFGRVR